ncbi:MAG: GNAT family N-acetyltransferase [Hyphomicrobiales bacterium]|nr:GNAT family N-acetyltransferase [Hyphomicrobiales bacterium]
MIDAAHYHAVEILPDGQEIEIRAQRPEDREGIRAALARASAESLYHRFFAVKREFSETEVHYFLDIDFVKHVALVALADENGRPTIIGGSRYIVVRPGIAEIAFSVIDAYQHRGVGSALMRHIAALARAAGLKEFVAEVMADNVLMLKVFEESGLPMSTDLSGTTVDVSLRLSGEDAGAG